MLLIKLESKDPYYNFATEEYFLNNYKEEFFLTSCCDDAISVGRNQNTMEEVNLMYVKQNNIKVIRRNSGGGAVFHDRGCINYSFIVKDDGSAIDDFGKYTQPIIDFLKEKFEIDAVFQPRNDIFVDGKKVSGMAKTRSEGKIVQHGTLLFSTSLKTLASSLKSVSSKVTENQGESLELPVVNLSSAIEAELSAEKFMDMLIAFIKNKYKKAIPYVLTKEDKENIDKIVAEKYSTWEWNYGNSPDYDIKKTIVCPCGKIEVLLKVEQGTIQDVKIFGDFFADGDISDLEDILKNNPHKCDILLKAMRNIDIKKYFGDISKRFFVESLF